MHNPLENKLEVYLRQGKIDLRENFINKLKCILAEKNLIMEK